MPKYNESKIYIIKTDQSDKIYVGATTKRLCQRMAQHRDKHNKFTQHKSEKKDVASELLDYSDVCIQLLENVEAKNKDELNVKLQQYRDSYKDKII
jgi:predicted GIY-YIG superfamily endonuclease